VLGPPKYHAVVGRSSKVQSKNIFPAADNGWFDNRVMSRDHAGFSALPKFQEVYIIDTDSMHGTWVNGSKLTSGRQTLLEEGDVLTFGAEVSRASGKLPHLTTTNLFAGP
jgi:predicted component of type VI protein secretion system